MARSLEWMDRMACRGIDGFTELPWQDQLKVCNRCDVRPECLEFGLGTADLGTVKRDGIVYGGLAPVELHRLLKQRQKAAAACPAPARLQVTAQLPRTGAEREALVENVTELLEYREDPGQIVRRVAAPSAEALGRRLQRAGRTDLARPFWAARQRGDA